MQKWAKVICRSLLPAPDVWMLFIEPHQNSLKLVENVLGCRTRDELQQSLDTEKRQRQLTGQLIS